MSMIQKLAFLCVMNVLTENGVVCMSLKALLNNSICNDNILHRGIEGHSQVSDSIAKHLVTKTSTNKVLQFRTTAKALGRNPCVLAEMASSFDVNSLRLLVARRYFQLFKALRLCNDVYSRPIKRKSVVYIRGDENSFKDLKKNALCLFARDIRCFVLICSGICSSFMLNIAVMSGFGVDTYIWITIAEPVVTKELVYPNKLTVVALAAENSQVSNQSNHFILKLFYGSTSTVAKIQQDLQGKKGIVPSKIMYLREVITHTDGERRTILHSRQVAATREKITLRIATIRGFANDHTTSLLDYDEMKCVLGLLCWYHPLKNGTFAKQREPSCCVGLIMDILLKLKEDLDIELYIHEVEGHDWGHEINGSWTGLIGEVVSGRADVAAQSILVTSKRLQVVDFTEFFLETNLALISKYQYIPLPYFNSEAFAPLTLQSWILILAFTVLIGGLIYLGERQIDLHSSFDFGVEILIYAMGLLFQRDIGGLIPKNLGSRVVSISLALALMIVMTTYTAVLTTRNLETTKKLPISGLSDPRLVHPTLTFKIGTYKDLSTLFENSKPTWRKIGKFMKPYSFNNFSESQKKLESGTLHAAMISDTSLKVQWKNGIGCDLGIAQNILEQQSAFALPKESQWRRPISDMLGKYKENGFLDNFKRKYLASKCPKIMEDKPPQFGILYLSGACIMLTLGLFVGGFLLSLEHGFKKYVKKGLRRRRSSYSFPHNTDALNK